MLVQPNDHAGASWKLALLDCRDEATSIINRSYCIAQ